MLISSTVPQATVIGDQLGRLYRPLISCCYYYVYLSLLYYPYSHVMWMFAAMIKLFDPQRMYCEQHEQDN